MMKRTYRNRMAIALLSATGLFALAACDKDSDSLLPGTPVESLTIDTHVNGYMPEGAAAGTRASTSGNTFKFTTGDAIGLIALKNGSVSRYNNVKLTYSGDGSWSGTKIYDCGATSYIAYYPYRADMAGKTSVDAIKSAFPIQDNQSTEANFNASNLMTAAAIPNGGSLKFSFTPAFAMVEVTQPDELLGYSNGSGEDFSYKFYNSSLSLKFSPDGFFKASDNKTYRKIIRPGSASEITIVAGYQDIIEATFQKTVTIGSGNYKKLLCKPISYNLALGDFVFKVGETLAFLPAKSSNFSNANCIGIVFKMGTGGSDSPSNYEGKLSAIHGYAMALYDGPSGAWCTHTELIGTSTEKNDYLGYSNTKKLRERADFSQSVYPVPYNATITYTTSHSLPATTSGWYLPSFAQCQTWKNNQSTLLSSVRKATEVSDYNWKQFYRSSTERMYSNSQVEYTLMYGLTGAEVSSKSYSIPFRSCFTF